jgi:hypothetical protein
MLDLAIAPNIDARGDSGHAAGSGLSIGTVGWSNDGGNAFSLGSGANNGVSLVNVTLFEGKDPLVSLQAGVGQGQKLLCQLTQDIIVCPPYGSRVLVARPGPNPHMPGHSVVLATLGNTAWKRAGNSSEGGLVIPAPSGPGRIVLTASGGFAFVTEASDGSTIQFSIGPNSGVHFTSPWGSLDFDNYGLRGNVGGGPSFNIYNVGGLPTPLSIAMGSIIQLSAGMIKLDSLLQMLGPDSTSTAWGSTTAVNDSSIPPGTPLLGNFFASLMTYFNAVEAVMTSLLTEPAYTGVTPAQIAAVQSARQALTAATTQATTQVATTTTVKVAFPAPSEV